MLLQVFYMEDSEAVASSSSLLVDSSIIGNGESAEISLPTDDMEDSEAVASSSSPLVDSSIIGNGESAQTSLPTDDMEDSEVVASSSLPLVDSSIIGNGEGAQTSLPTDVSRGDGSSEEAWFDDDCDNDHELHNEWKLRRDKFYNDGYREGIIEGQKDAAQDGFNLGFRHSVMAGYKWGIVRGVTSALAHLPDEVKEKLVEKEETRIEFLKLQGQVDSMATEEALELFYNNIKKENSGEQSSSVNSDPSLAQQTDCDGLKTYVEKLELLLKESRAINVGLESSENAGS